MSSSSSTPRLRGVRRPGGAPEAASAAAELMVCRLFAGGEWIRTFSSARRYASVPGSSTVTACLGLSPRRRLRVTIQRASLRLVLAEGDPYLDLPVLPSPSRCGSVNGLRRRQRQREGCVFRRLVVPGLERTGRQASSGYLIAYDGRRSDRGGVS